MFLLSTYFLFIYGHPFQNILFAKSFSNEIIYILFNNNFMNNNIHEKKNLNNKEFSQLHIVKLLQKICITTKKHKVRKKVLMVILTITNYKD